MTRRNQRHAEIWAIGGGKGGIGKSFLISNVANYLALHDKKVVLIDADLGGANLHTFFGVNKPRTTLTEFFDEKIPIEALIIDSGIQNLELLVGAVGSLAMDSIKYTQKQKLLRHIRKLRADYILIDLGAGTHFNAIDTFLLANKMIVCVVPEIIAIENLYYYLKNVFYRKLITELASHGLRGLVPDIWKHRRTHRIQNLRQLIQHLGRLQDPVPDVVASALKNFAVYIVLNKVRRRPEIAVGSSVKSICAKYFGFHACSAGYIEHDDFVPICINKRQPYMQAYPASRCTQEIGEVAENLIHGRPFVRALHEVS
ncbi:Flagellar synthesis regulator FleN [Olavius algarvensis associated proteobacterium Delta 3]|nr:Flagellar synthesis regulator FleN [Olavius algarvensis associated proteobacterium Delta 3]